MTLWHTVPALQQAARAHVSKVPAECFVIRSKHFTFNVKDEKEQSDKHHHLDCQLKGRLTLSRFEAIYILYMSIYIYIGYVCFSTV